MISEPFGSTGGCAEAARLSSVAEISMFENLCEFL